MRIFLDECCPPQIAKGLRRAGHDVLHALTERRGASDTEQAAFAHFADRIVVTADYDYGDLAVRDNCAFAGLVLLAPDLGDLAKNADLIVIRLVQAIPNARGGIVSISKNRTRDRRLPDLI